MKFSFKNNLFVSLLFNTFFAVFPGYGMDIKNDFPAWTKSALIVKKNDTSILEIGQCDNPHAPYSTFKVALALMGFDAGVLQDKDSPLFLFTTEDENKLKRVDPNWYTPEIGEKYHWNQDHTPETYMKNSVLWFSFRITQALGKEKFQEYVSKLPYGNMDVSGTSGQNDGLLKSWLGTSLEISPRNQVEFLEKLFIESSVISKSAQEKTREIMNREEEWNGWKLYGKTGGGHTGWFIGWVEQEQERIFFAQYIDTSDENLDKEGLNIYETAGLKAKKIAKEYILKLLENK